MSEPSYVCGPAAKPLLGETIGENLRRTVERHPDVEALVVPYQGYRATYRQFFPMTVSGKIQKFKMRETAIRELGLERAASIRTA